MPDMQSNTFHESSQASPEKQSRVYCLYRVSTAKQADKDMNNEVDIPMQKRVCREYVDKMGWLIVKEFQENGISGFKKKSEDRDALQQCKKDALQKEYDILLVYMCDRIGRLASDTSALVLWFIQNGIQIWSVHEGPQVIESHMDNLTNYLRFWAAEGESRKTSERVKDRLRQIVEDGHYKGGTPAYGYKLVDGERISKKGHPLKELIINEEEAELVRLIFNQYVYNGMGKLALSKFLTERDHLNRKGERFHPNSIGRMIANPIYTGYLTCGEVRSQHLPHLQIINQDLFDKASAYKDQRKPGWDMEKRRSPVNMRGQALLSGNLFCGHCGSRMTLSTTRYHGGTEKHVRYTCYYKNRKLKKCDGQTTYSVKKLDAIIEQVMYKVFEQIRSLPHSQIIGQSLMKQVTDLQKQLYNAEMELIGHQRAVETYESEIIKILHGQSKFTEDRINKLLDETEAKACACSNRIDSIKMELTYLNKNTTQMEDGYNEIMKWSRMFGVVDTPTRKLICNHVLERVDISRNYILNIKLSATVEQFGISFQPIDICAPQ